MSDTDNTSAAAIPTVEQLQAGANAWVQSETARLIGELTLGKTSAEAIADVWQKRAAMLEQALELSQAELRAARGHHEAAQQEAHQARHIAAQLGEELEALRPAKPKSRAKSAAPAKAPRGRR